MIYSIAVAASVMTFFLTTLLHVFILLLLLSV